MNIFSPEFLFLFFIAVVILTLRARKKRGNIVLTKKQIAVKGNQLVTYLSKDAPLICLLADGRIYGDDYQDKEVPELPHSDNCRCELREYIRRGREMFPESTKEIANQMSDLGSLNNSDARYYRFLLIAHHPEASEATQMDYQSLAQSIKVSDEFSRQVSTHLTR